ncbi:MAG TPA: hypothetical protein VG078_06315 [Acidimicrobiales bacterium]|nr:hypothetical protein [Acidimicrobiales bacterium]
MDRKTRATGASVLIALGGLVAALMLMAGPAAAQAHEGHGGGGGGQDHGTAPGGHHEAGPTSGHGVTHDRDSTASGGCFAAHGSVCSGSGVAIDNSTSSGDAVAVGGSVASGCSTAVDGSTASGGEPCPRHEGQRKPPPGKRHGPGPAPTGGHQAEAGVAEVVETTELAFTGSSTGLLAGAAAAALALGGLLVFLGSDRRRPAHSS